MRSRSAWSDCRHDGLRSCLGRASCILLSRPTRQISFRRLVCMPAYANDAGKVVIYFRPGQRFNERYMTFGIQRSGETRQGTMWPTSFALTDLTPADEERIAALGQEKPWAKVPPSGNDMKARLVAVRPGRNNVITFLFEPEKPLDWDPGQFIQYISAAPEHGRTKRRPLLHDRCCAL